MDSFEFYTIVYVYNATGVSDEDLANYTFTEDYLVTILILAGEHNPDAFVKEGVMDELIELLPTGTELACYLFVVKAVTYKPSNKSEVEGYLEHIKEHLNTLIMGEDLIKVDSNKFMMTINQE